MLFNKLSDSDKDMISNYISYYAGCPNGQHQASLEYILRYWDTEKSNYLWDLMGHEFILEKKINYTKNNVLITESISDVLKMEGHQFEMEYLNKVIRPLRSSINWFGGARTDNEQYRITCYYALEKLMDPVTLAANLYDGVSLKIANPKDGNHPISLNQGCKVVRVLGKIADAYDLEGYEEFRLAHSRVLNDKKISGTLCLSIHPMDYMTMSDNNSDWESCMNWQNEGCYRQGTVEMMNSPMVVVGYLKSKDDMCVDMDHKWNNKRWRCLFLVTADFITSIMAYPYPHEELTVACVDWLRDLAMQNLGWRYDDDKPTTYKSQGIDVVRSDGKINVITKGDWYDHVGLTLNGEDVTEDEIYHYIEKNPDTRDAKIARFCFETYLMYNDFSRTDHYAYFNTAGILTDYSIKCSGPDKYSPIQNYVYYSGKSECMNCGNIDVDFADEGQLCCTNCDDYITCEKCGERILKNEAYVMDGYYYCECCYHEDVGNCDVCGEDRYNEDLFFINFVPKPVYDYFVKYGIKRPSSSGFLNSLTAYEAIFCFDCGYKLKELIGYKGFEDFGNYYLPYDDEILEKMSHNSNFSYIADCIKRYETEVTRDFIKNYSDQAMQENLYPTF